MKKSKIYALYKGEEQLAEGTLNELTNKFKIKKKSLLFYQSPAYLRRMEKSHIGNYKVLVRVA